MSEAKSRNTFGSSSASQRRSCSTSEYFIPAQGRITAIRVAGHLRFLIEEFSFIRARKDSRLLNVHDAESAVKHGAIPFPLNTPGLEEEC